LLGYFLQHKYTIQVDEVPLERSPLVDELQHVFDDFLNFKQFVVKVPDVRIGFQNAHSQREFFKHADELRQLGHDDCLAIRLDLQFEFDRSHFLVERLQCQLKSILFGGNLANLFDRFQFLFIIKLEYYEPVKCDIRRVDRKLKLRTNHAPVTSHKTFGPQGAQHGPIFLEVCQ
jgi:hypothetical protein